MPRKKEEESSDDESEEEESEEEESGSEGSEEDSEEEGSDDEEDDSDEDGSDGSDEESEDDDEDETPRSSNNKSKNKKEDGLLNISLTIDKENGKVISSKVEEKKKENSSSPSNQPPSIETSTAMTQTDYNMFFPPLSEALYQASTSSQRRDELLNQAKRILLAPDNSWRNTRYSPQIPPYQQQTPIYKPISSPYTPTFDHSSSTRPGQYYQQHHNTFHPTTRDPYSYSGSSSFKPVGPHTSNQQSYQYYDQPHQYKHYPPPPRQFQPSPSEHNVRFQEESNRHYYDRNAPSSFKPINEMDNYSNNSASPNGFSEDNRYGRYINPKFM